MSASTTATIAGAGSTTDEEASAGPVAEALILSAALSLGLILALLLLGSAAMIAGVGLGRPFGAWLAAAAVLATGAAFLRFPTNMERPALLGALALTLALWLGAILLAGSVYDWSWDGQHYHQELILQLSDGWNPVWETFRAEERGLNDGEIGLWLNHYPRAAAVIGAPVYQLTGAIETAKFINPLLMALTGLYAAALLRSLAGLSWLWSALLALALAANAIASAQMLTFYNDGLLACGMALIALAGAHLLARPGAAPLLILAGAVLLTANIKFTGLVFAVATLGFVGMAALWRSGGRVGSVLPLAALFAGLLALSLLAIGPSPYLQNLWTAGHPFHPLMGADAFDIVTRSKPKAFLDLSAPEALLASLIGAPEGGVARYEARDLFLPPSAKELTILAWVDPRIGGWGPMFAEQLILAGVGAAAMLLWARRRAAAAIGAFGLGAALFLALIHPEAWWARYSSFLLIGPWILFAAAAAAGETWTRLLAAAGLALMLGANLSVGGTATAKAYEVSGKISDQVEAVKAAPGPVALSTGLFHANRVKLSEAGVEARIVPRAADLPCAEPKGFYNGHWISRACY